MKNLYFLLVAFVFSSLGFAQNSMITFQADIANRNGDVIYIKDNDKTIQEIKVDKDNVFKATFEVKEGLYLLFDGVEYTELFLKNGYNLKLKMDAKQFDDSIKYSGKGEAENNFLAQTTIAEKGFRYDELLEANEVDFTKMVDDKKNSDFKKLDSGKLDPNFVSMQKQNIETSLLGLRQYYNQKLAANKMNNKPSAGFDYENQKGGRTKLEELKGKYVYIDVWATWCGPCRGEIPFLQKIEEQYKGKNIEFVSISVDVAKDHDKWKNFVTDKQLGGIQLLADKDWKSDFIMSYGINSIPRFILLDPNGVIVKGDAVRPSDPKLLELLDSLLK